MLNRCGGWVTSWNTCSRDSSTPRYGCAKVVANQE